MFIFANIIELLGIFSLWAIGLLPDIDMGTYTTISNGYLSFKQFIANINFLLPVPMLLTLMGLVWTIEFSMFTWKFLNWILKKTVGR